MGVRRRASMRVSDAVSLRPAAAQRRPRKLEASCASVASAGAMPDAFESAPPKRTAVVTERHPPRLRVLVTFGAIWGAAWKRDSNGMVDWGCEDCRVSSSDKRIMSDGRGSHVVRFATLKWRLVMRVARCMYAWSHGRIHKDIDNSDAGCPAGPHDMCAIHNPSNLMCP